MAWEVAAGVLSSVGDLKVEHRTEGFTQDYSALKVVPGERMVILLTLRGSAVLLRVRSQGPCLTLIWGPTYIYSDYKLGINPRIIPCLVITKRK